MSVPDAAQVRKALAYTSWLMAPWSILRNPSFTMQERTALLVIISHCDLRNGDDPPRTWIGNAKLGLELGCGSRNVRKLIVGLESKGAIRVEWAPRSRMIYLCEWLRWLWDPDDEG